MKLINIYERTFTVGEIKLIKSGIQAAFIHSGTWLDDEACVVSCDWHGENSKCLEKLSFHNYPIAPENIFKTMYKSKDWLYEKILELTTQFDVESIYWRTEPTNYIKGFMDWCAPYKALAIATFLKGEKL